MVKKPIFAIMVVMTLTKEKKSAYMNLNTARLGALQ